MSELREKISVRVDLITRRFLEERAANRGTTLSEVTRALLLRGLVAENEGAGK